LDLTTFHRPATVQNDGDVDPVRGESLMSDETSERPSQLTPGTRLSFELSSDRGCVVLTLSDGAVLHVHPIVVDVVKNTQTDERGEPSYTIAGGLAVRVMIPPGSKG
jgi:hypothetical protein